MGLIAMGLVWLKEKADDYLEGRRRRKRMRETPIETTPTTWFSDLFTSPVSGSPDCFHPICSGRDNCAVSAVHQKFGEHVAPPATFYDEDGKPFQAGTR